MKRKHLTLFSILVIIALFVSACASTVYASTGWYGLTASSDTAYLAAGSQVYAIDLNTHAEKWHYPEKANSKISFYANPVLTADGQLLVPSYDHNLYSLNPSNNGSLNWTFSGPKNRLIASPLVIQNTAYQPSSDGSVYAIDLSTHNSAWDKPASTGGPIWATPATAPNCNCIYVASMDHKVYKFDAATGRQLDVSDDLGGAIVGTPAISENGILYIGTFGKEFFALDASNLKSMKWSSPFHTNDWVWSGPALENNVLYFGDLSGNFYALNAVDGTTKFPVLQVNKPIVDTPLVTGDKIYFTAETDMIYITDTTGNITSKSIGGTIYSAPVLAGETVLVTPTGYTSQLVALSPDGTPKWAFPPAK